MLIICNVVKTLVQNIKVNYKFIIKTITIDSQNEPVNLNEKTKYQTALR